MKYFTIVVWTIILAACGGGGGGSSNTPTPTPNTTCENKVVNGEIVRDCHEEKKDDKEVKWK